MQHQLPAPPPHQPSPVTDPSAAWLNFSQQISHALESTDTQSSSNDRTWRSNLEPACHEMSACGMAEVSISWFVELVSDDWENQVVTNFNQALEALGQRRSAIPLDELGRALSECLQKVADRQASCLRISHVVDACFPQLPSCSTSMSQLSGYLNVLVFGQGVSVGDYFQQHMFSFLARLFRVYRIKVALQAKEQRAERRFNGSMDDDQEDDASDEDDDADEDESENDEYNDIDHVLAEDRAIDHKAVARAFGRQILALGWAGPLEGCFTDLLYRETERAVLNLCKGNFESAYLHRTKEWLHDVVLPWLRELLLLDDPIDESVTGDLPPPLLMGADAEMLNIIENKTINQQRRIASNTRNAPFAQWKARLEFHVYETFCVLRMSEIFDIIRDFPESTPCLHDLKAALGWTHQNRELASMLRHAFATRLLHPGAHTSQIIDVYISTIKALRILDPTGVLLEAISEPIKEYLRMRTDTVRCIVTSLTDGSNSELFEELAQKQESRSIEQNYENSDGEDDAGGGGPEDQDDNWMPDPVESDPSRTSRSRLSNDILSMLVHIYGSKELFVNEYRAMLADKLFTSLEFDIDREVHNLELLKLRFGESSMHQCEIMVKDMVDSKRIKTNIKSAVAGDWIVAPTDGNGSIDLGKTSALGILDLDATIISRQFWPRIKEDAFEMHPVVKEAMDRFSKEYALLKTPRSLVWKTHLGIVQVKLEFDDGNERVFNVTPFQATIISYFADRDSWTISALATHLGVDTQVLQRRAFLWVNQGVLLESKQSNDILYTAAKTIENGDGDSAAPFDQQRDSNAGAAGRSGVAADIEDEIMQVYESYITGMLTNFEALPLERIHNMLKMFVSTGEHKYDKHVEELAAFLNRLVDQEKLECSGDGVYRLKK